MNLEFDSRMWRRILRWVAIMALEVSGLLGIAEGEKTFVVVRCTKGRILYKEGPYTQDTAFPEAERYAKLIELLGMDKALHSIRREMRAC